MRKRSGQVYSRESSATLQLTVSLLYHFGIVTLNSLGKDSTILEKEWGEKYEKHIFLKTDFLCVEPICRDHLSRLYSVQRTLYRKQLPCSFSIFVALVF